MSDRSPISSRNSVPVVGELEPPGLAIVRAGERALLVAEDFRLEQRVGQRRAVDGLELRRAAPAQLVNHARDDFLARSGRPEDQHRDVRLGGGADPLEDDQHLLVAADHLAEALHRRRLVFGADGGAPLEEVSSSSASASLAGRSAHVARRRRPAARGPRRSRPARARSSRRRAAGGRTSASAIRRRSSRRAARSGTGGCRRAAATAPACETASRGRAAPTAAPMPRRWRGAR